MGAKEPAERVVRDIRRRTHLAEKARPRPVARLHRDHGVRSLEDILQNHAPAPCRPVSRAPKLHRLRRGLHRDQALMNVLDGPARRHGLGVDRPKQRLADDALPAREHRYSYAPFR